ncbi:hypothetical protein, partial [Erwinia amylovora]|uniref:hypothetical protein n=1 Tax=Erwinia amylovora TaxID=552 RepID=UPI0020BF2124
MTVGNVAVLLRAVNMRLCRLGNCQRIVHLIREAHADVFLLLDRIFFPLCLIGDVTDGVQLLIYFTEISLRPFRLLYSSSF